MIPSQLPPEERIAKALSPFIRDMLQEQIREHRQRDTRRGDAEISAAAGVLGRAIDKLQAAKFTPREPGARLQLEKAAVKMQHVMEKYGRMP